MLATPQSTEVETNSQSGIATTAAIRRIVVMTLVAILIYLCMQTDHAGSKGTSIEPWRLVPVLAAAILFSLIGKRFINSIAGVFLGGIGGAFGMLDSLNGPYGGVVGLVVGAIVVAIPVCHKPRSKAAG